MSDLIFFPLGYKGGLFTAATEVTGYVAVKLSQHKTHQQIWWGNAPFLFFPCRKRVHGSLGTGGACSSRIWLLGFCFCVRPGDFAAVFLLRTKHVLVWCFFFLYFPLCVFLRWMIFEIIGVQSLVEQLTGKQVQSVSSSRQNQWQRVGWKSLFTNPLKIW